MVSYPLGTFLRGQNRQGISTIVTFDFAKQNTFKLVLESDSLSSKTTSTFEPQMPVSHMTAIFMTDPSEVEMESNSSQREVVHHHNSNPQQKSSTSKCYFTPNNIPYFK